MHVEFESSLVKVLKALFGSSEGKAVAVYRFWLLLPVKLTALLDVTVFPRLSASLQVCISQPNSGCDSFLTYGVIVGMKYSPQCQNRLS
jgi:hypothetical protein